MLVWGVVLDGRELVAGPTLGLQHPHGRVPGQDLHPYSAGSPLPELVTEGVVVLADVLGRLALVAGPTLELQHLPGGVPGQGLHLCSEEGPPPWLMTEGKWPVRDA